MKLKLTKDRQSVQIAVLLAAAAIFLVTWVYPLAVMAIEELGDGK